MSWLRFKNLFSRQKNGLVLLLIGLFCFTLALSIKGYQEFRQNILSFSQAPEVVEVISEEDLPVRILIPKLKIDLPVFPAKVSNNDWPVFKEAVSYLVGSGLPGQAGNTVIYGHNKTHLLGPIRWLAKNDKVKVVNKKEEEFVYQVVETKTVTPENIEILSPTEGPTLTLYTCTGFLDKERFVVIAKLQPDLK